MTAVNFSKPVTSDLRADVLSYIRDYMAGQAKMFDGDTLTATPTGTVRYSAANVRFEKWNGTGWVALALDLLPLAGGTLTGALTGTTANFTGGLQMNGNAVWHVGNLTPSNYLPLAGGTMAGVLNSLNILPTANSVSNIGSDALRYAGVYASNFYESGVALSAKYAANSHSHAYLPTTGGALTGSLTGTSASFSGSLTAAAGNFTSSLTVNGTAVSLAGHTHAYLSTGGGSISGNLTIAGTLVRAGKGVVTSDYGTSPYISRGIAPPSGGVDGDLYCQHT